MKNKKKLLSLLLAAAMVLSLLPTTTLTAQAATTVCDVSTGTVDISGAGDYVVMGSSLSNIITVSGTGVFNITLVNVNINLPSSTSSPFSVGDGLTVNLTLVGENTLTAHAKGAGIKVPSSAKLTITADSTGSLTATGGINGAGIGSGEGGSGGTVTINGGTVTATGGTFSAGIGGGVGGSGGSGGTVTISGGTVTATGSDGGEDIGAGYNSSDNGNLYIDGGSVNADFADTAYQTSAETTKVYKTTVGGLTKVSSGSAVTCSINSGDEFSCATDADTKLYLWLPSSESGEALIANDSSYYKASGKIFESNDNALTASECIYIATDSLADGIVGTVYGETLSAFGGSGSYTWTIDSGTLPDGLELSEGSGVLSGTPSETGEFSFTVLATDGSSITGSQNLSITVNQTFSADLTALSVSGGALSLTFDRDIAAYAVTKTSGTFGGTITVTATMADPSSSLTIGGYDVTCDASGTGTKTVSLSNGANLIPVTVSIYSVDDDTTVLSQKSYILSVNGTVSDAELDSLSIGGDAQTVNASTDSYVYSVASDVTLIDIIAVPSDSKAIMLLNGAILASGDTGSVDLDVGENTVTLMVVAQDASFKTYTITVNRGTSDATLSDLAISDGTLSPSFDPEIYSGYTATVSNSTDSLTVTPTANDSGATVKVKVNGNTASTSADVDLSVGDNTITVEVLGADGVTTKTYTITVTRETAITITTASLPVGIVGASYSKTLSATGGSGDYTWTWAAASGSLPANIDLSSDGTLALINESELTTVDIGSYSVEITVTDIADATVTQTLDFTLTIRAGCGNGAYVIESNGDTAYTGSYTDDGIPTLTVNTGYTGFTYFSVDITAVTGHSGTEVCVFVQTRDGEQIGISGYKSNFDAGGSASACFNVKAGDVIKVYLVDALSNGAASNPNIL